MSISTAVADTLLQIADDEDLLEIARLEIEDTLVELRDNHTFQMRNNGLVIKDRDSTSSDVIRMGSDDAVRIGLQAIAKALQKRLS